MAKILAWTALMAGAYATSHHEGGEAPALPVVLSTDTGGHKGASGYGGGYGGGYGYGGRGYGHGGYGYGKGGVDANIQVGVTIITTNVGGGAKNQEWNDPEMDAGVTHEVTVGGEAGLIFSPEQLHANVGDMVQFNFQSENHTVTQSGFDTPCDMMAGGVDSGFMPNPTDEISPPPMMMFQVTTEEPVWMYCRQGSHCGEGMVFSINPTEEKSHEAFKANAIATVEDVVEDEYVAPPAASSSAPPVVIGSSSAVAPPPAATPPAEEIEQDIVQGDGFMGTGDACSCSCLCSAGGFPEGAGIGSVGGLGGTMMLGGTY